MADERIVTVVEMDLDTCSRTWGVGACTASFGGAVTHKCYNTFPTCSVKSAYLKTTKTIRFIEPSFDVKNADYIPSIVSVTGYEQEINIAGYNPQLGGLGKRASVDITFEDMPSRDVLLDPYWAGRMDGTAQTSGGYDPINRGSFWTKFKARNSNYAGRPIRVIQARITTAGAVVYDKIRSYVMTEIKGPGDSGRVTVTAKDILSLADNTKAQAPITSQGRLLNDITAGATSATLSPAGIGNAEYPASGYVTIGSEVIRFTRAGNTLTLNRAQKGTVAASHTANDTVQLAFNVELQRADAVIRDLLINYAKIPSAYIPFGEWQAEFDKWGSSMFLSATICKPTGVSQLIGEISLLGITVWWDEIAQRIRIRLNHPAETIPATLSDRDNIMSITQEDNDNERATRIAFWHMQIDPTKELGKDNFLRGYITVFVDGESPDFYGESRTHTIYTRWFNHGADNAAKIITGRLLNRYKIAPVTYVVKLDNKDYVNLADVVTLNSHVSTDVTGLEVPVLTQVYSRKDGRAGNDLTVKLQIFQFNARYGVITENSRPRYNASSAAQKLKGSYFVGPTMVFADGAGPYQFV